MLSFFDKYNAYLNFNIWYVADPLFSIVLLLLFNNSEMARVINVVLWISQLAKLERQMNNSESFIVLKRLIAINLVDIHYIIALK